MSSLSDFTQNKIQARIKKKSPFCSIKDYKKITITSDVTKVSFGVTYNTLGHVLFGSLSFGMASIAAEVSKSQEHYFDTSSGALLGSTQAEAETYYNNKVNTCINNFELIAAEKYLSKLCGLSNSKANRSKYDVIKKLNVSMKKIENGQIQEAIAIFETINTNLSSLPKQLKIKIEKLKTELEKFNSINTNAPISIPEHRNEENCDIHLEFTRQTRVI